mgnify:CR=1 FL=1
MTQPPARSDPIDVTSDLAARPDLFNAMANSGTLYTKSGALVSVEPGKDGAGPRVEHMTADSLRTWFADRVETFKVKSTGEVPTMVSTSLTRSLLKPGSRLPELRGLTRWPVITPAGKVHATRGYDRETRLYCDPAFEVPAVSDAPTPAEVEAARRLIVDDMLGGFPWVADSDRAQYVAALLAPILRTYQPGPTPLVAISAHAPGTGKSYLGTALGVLYPDQAFLPPNLGGDRELSKNITSLFRHNPVGASILIDNIPENRAVDSPTLAAFLTSPVWQSRLIGSGDIVTAANDKILLVTGNSLVTGGDIARRTMWVRLSAPGARPEEREFEEDFMTWLERRKADVLHALLTIARGWIVAGAPRREVRLGSFGAFASMMAGCLDWAGITGFNKDRHETSEQLDAQAEDWGDFLREWRALFGTRRRKASAILGSTLRELVPMDDGRIVKDPQRLAYLLRAHKLRYYGGHRVARIWDPHIKGWTYVVLVEGEPVPDERPTLDGIEAAEDVTRATPRSVPARTVPRRPRPASEPRRSSRPRRVLRGVPPRPVTPPSGTRRPVSPTTAARRAARRARLN